MNTYQENNGQNLERKLGLFDSSMIMVGIMIGSGIFITTGIMAKYIPSPLLIMAAWLFGGLITLAGSLTYAELGAMLPKAGGQYVYLREAYGSLAGYLFGWIVFWVYQTGGIAGLAIAFAEYFGYIFKSLASETVLLNIQIPFFGHNPSLNFTYGHVTAVTVVLFLTLLNFLGLGFGKNLQNFLSSLKIGAILVFVIIGFAFGKGAGFDFSLNPSGLKVTDLITGFFLALIAVSWTYDGWNNITYVAGEIKKPGKNIPRALIFSTCGALLHESTWSLYLSRFCYQFR